MLTSGQNFSQPFKKKKKKLFHGISLYHLVKCFVLCFAIVSDTDPVPSSPQSEPHPARSSALVFKIFLNSIQTAKMY